MVAEAYRHQPGMDGEPRYLDGCATPAAARRHVEVLVAVDGATASSAA